MEYLKDTINLYIELNIKLLSDFTLSKTRINWFCFYSPVLETEFFSVKYQALSGYIVKI